MTPGAGTKRERIIVPDVDSRGRFELKPAEAMHTIVCIGCGCDELHPCKSGLQVQPAHGAGGCSWVAADEDAGVGLCSACAQKPLDELLVARAAEG